ncbi:hypothetical protein [Candidimonas sp. SYP-B2681]
MDTAVSAKAVAYPTDSCLLERSREHLVKECHGSAWPALGELTA